MCLHLFLDCCRGSTSWCDFFSFKCHFLGAAIIEVKKSAVNINDQVPRGRNVLVVLVSEAVAKETSQVLFGGAHQLRKRVVSSEKCFEDFLGVPSECVASFHPPFAEKPLFESFLSVLVIKGPSTGWLCVKQQEWIDKMKDLPSLSTS